MLPKANRKPSKSGGKKETFQNKFWNVSHL